jgi:hypothetical protein
MLKALGSIPNTARKIKTDKKKKNQRNKNKKHMVPHLGWFDSLAL